MELLWGVEGGGGSSGRGMTGVGGAEEGFVFNVPNGWAGPDVDVVGGVQGTIWLRFSA